MEVIIKATSSVIDDNTVLIETSVTIGDSVTTTRVGYDRQELLDNRYLSGTFEERVEALRQSAEAMTETSVRLHFQALAKIAKPEPVVTEVSPTGRLKASEPEIQSLPSEKPVKKPRQARAKKTTESAQ